MLLVIEGKSVNIYLTVFGKVKSPRIVFVNRVGTIIKEIPKLEKVTNFNSTNMSYIYEYTLNNIYDEFKYYGETIQTRDNIPVKTKEYSIKVVKPPFIKKLKLVYYFPKYTYLKSKVVEDNGNIEAVEKSVVKIIGTLNNPIRAGYIELKSGRKIKLNVSGNIFSGSIFVYANDEYKINITDIYNHNNNDPVRYQILVIKDNPPTIDITRPGMDIELADSLVVPLEIYGQDDYAVNSVSLKYKVQKAFVQIQGKEESIQFEIKPESEVKIDYKWDLNKIGITPGDVIVYYAVAYDGYTPKDEHLTASQKYLIKFPTVEDMYRDLNNEQRENVISLKELMEQQQKMVEDTEKVIKDLEKKEDLSYIEKKELEKLQENQKQIYNETKKVIKKLEQTSEKMKKNNMFTPQMLEKMDQIRDLMNKVADKNMQEAIQKLQEAVKNIELSSEKKKLLSTKLNQEEILKRLDKTLEMLKKLRQRQQLESFKKRADEIVKNQQNLLKKTIENKFDKKDNPDLLAKNQNKINNEFSQFKKEYKDFLDEIKKDSPETYKDLKNNLDKVEKANIDKEMQKSEDSLKKSEWDEAIKSQKKIISALDKIQSSCDRACHGMQQRDMTKILNAIDSAIFNFLQISYKTENIMEKLKTEKSISYIDSIDGSYIENDKNFRAAHLAEELIFLERTARYQMKLLEDETKDSIVFNPSFFDTFDQYYDAIGNARDNLANSRIFNAESYQRNALLYLNIIIKNLIELKEEFKNQAQKQSGGGMSDALNQLANAQQKLNELTEKLKGQVGKQGMTPELQEYLDELAFQQEMIRKSVGQFMENYKDAGKLLGNIAEAGKEMDEIKKKLKSGKIDSDLINKQHRALKRLLDAQKSVYVKEHSKKRESETAKEYKPVAPPELKEEKLKENENKYYYNVMEKYPMEYKRLVEDYFKILSTHEESVYNSEK